MKALKFAIIIFTVFALNSCNDIHKGEVEEETIYCCGGFAYNYLLQLSFQDESGNDLLERSGETKLEPYIYNINVDHRLFYKVIENTLLDDGYHYLTLNALVDENSTFFPFEKKIVFRFKDSSMFGDNEEHEIVTWWKPENDTELGKRNPICYIVEYGGKEFSVNKVSNVNFATIILGK